MHRLDHPRGGALGYLVTLRAGVGAGAGRQHRLSICDGEMVCTTTASGPNLRLGRFRNDLL
jgi:hypothetical protein